MKLKHILSAMLSWMEQRGQKFWSHPSLLSMAARQWNSTFFDFSLIFEGATENVLQFMMPLRSMHNPNIGCIKQILYFRALQKGSNNKGSINWHKFCHENILLVTFLELPLIILSQYYTKMRWSITPSVSIFGIFMCFSQQKLDI